LKIYDDDDDDEKEIGIYVKHPLSLLLLLLG
jgi:hypothetical protein